MHEDGHVLGGLEQAEGMDDQLQDWGGVAWEVAQISKVPLENMKDLEDDHLRRLTESPGPTVLLRDRSEISVHARTFDKPSDNDW